MLKNSYRSKNLGHGFLVKEHRLIAERALGHKLPESAPVHHVNGIKSDNGNSNLVICEDVNYHQLLHRRTRILKLGADPNTENICGRCKQIKPLTEFGNHRGVPTNRCKACNRSLANARHAAKPKTHNRVTHCKYGHEFTPENTLPVIQQPIGKRRSVYNGRHCRTCIALNRERRNARKRERRLEVKRLEGEV